MPTRRPGKPRPPCRPSDLTVALRAKESTEWRRAMRAAVNLLSGKDEEPLSRVRLKHGSTTAGSHLADDQRLPGAPGDTLGPPGGRSSPLDDAHIDRGHLGEASSLKVVDVVLFDPALVHR